MSDLVEKSVSELAIDSGELQVIRHRLCQEKTALQGELAELNNKFKLRLPNQQFFSLSARRVDIVKQIAEKEIEIGEINAKRAELNTVTEIRKKQSFGPSVVKALCNIRDKYHSISMDSSQHQKAREVAWKFSQELGAVLKTLFDSSRP